jgi:hypothetical protein
VKIFEIKTQLLAKLVKCIDCICLYLQTESSKDESKDFCVKLRKEVDNIERDIECDYYIYIPDFPNFTKLKTQDMYTVPL